MCGFGSIGEAMAADLHRADAQPDITGSVLEQEIGKSPLSRWNQGYGYVCELRSFERCPGGTLR